MKTSAKSSAAKTGRRAAKPPVTYRGVVLQPIPEPTRFTREQLEKAIDAAIAKNPDAFVSGTKT